MVVLKTQRFIRIADCQNIIGSKSNTSAILVVVSLNSTILTTLRLVHFLVFALIWVLFQFHRILSAALSTRVALTPTQRGNSTPTPSTSSRTPQGSLFPMQNAYSSFLDDAFRSFYAGEETAKSCATPTSSVFAKFDQDCRRQDRLRSLRNIKTLILVVKMYISMFWGKCGTYQEGFL